jgi:flagellar motor switch protein FliM
MNRILTQEEVDALLTAVDRGELPEPASRPPRAPSRRAVTYNFRRPNRISKDQVRMFESIHDTFARLAASSLTTLTRGVVEVELTGVEQATYAEFVMALAPPLCVAVFNMEPLRGGAALEINARLLFRFIDRLLGGSGLLPVRVREFTEVEQVLVERVTVRLMMDLQQAWHRVATFGFRVSHLETNPQFLQLTAPGEVVILVNFTVRAGDVEGPMTLAFPHLLLEGVLPQLDSHRPFAVHRPLTREEREGLYENLLRLGLEIRAVLAEPPLTVRQLLELEPGDVIPLGRPTTAPAVVEIEGVPRFTAQPGVTGSRRAVRILAVLPKGEIIRDAGQSGSARVYAP